MNSSQHYVLQCSSYVAFSTKISHSLDRKSREKRVFQRVAFVTKKSSAMNFVFVKDVMCYNVSFLSPLIITQDLPHSFL